MIHKQHRKYYSKNHCVCGDHFDKHWFEELSDGEVLFCDVCNVDCKEPLSVIRAAKFMERRND